MDAEELASITGLSLAEAQTLSEWSGAAPVQEPRGSAETTEETSTPDLDFLKACFPNIPMAVIKIKLDSCHDIEQASDLLLNYEATKHEQNQYFDRQVARRAKHNAKRSKKQDTADRKMKQEIEGLVQVIDGLSFNDAKALYEQNECKFDKAVTAHFKLAAPHVQALIAEMEQRRPTVNRGFSRSNSDCSYDSQDVLRQQSRDEQALAAELENYESLRKVKGVPGVLLSESRGKISTLKARLADLEVMGAQLQYANNGTVVDFHNMTVRAAIAVCTQRLSIWKENNSEHQLHLITGAGRHSADGVPRIKNAIRDLIKAKNDRSYFIKEEEGAFTLVKSRV